MIEQIKERRCMRDIEKVNPVAVDNKESQEFEIDIVELLLRLAECWKYIVACAVVGTVIMAIYSFIFATPMYEATSKLYVISNSDSAINLSDLQLGTALTADYTEVFNTWEVHEIVRQNLGLDYEREELSEMVAISNPSDTRVLYITVTNKDPKLAADIANEYAGVAKQYISMTMQTDEPTDFSEALVPEKPVSPKKKLNVAIGFALGAFGACAVIVIQFLMDDKIKTADDIRKYTGLPTLAVVPDNDEASKEQIGEKSKSSGSKNGRSGSRTNNQASVRR